MEKEFIPYEQALELKELGFNEPCFGNFADDEKHTLFTNGNRPGKTNAPTFSQAFRWFREKYDLKEQYGVFPHHTIMLNYVIEGGKEEEAELACLIKLIEIVKKTNNMPQQTDNYPKEEPKQETTLEEAAEKYINDDLDLYESLVDGHISYNIGIDLLNKLFTAGAKWQQEQDKNESTADYIDRHLVQALVEVGKQNPAVYSEEDVKSVIEKTVEQCNKMMQESYGLLEIDVDYILEQFKNK